MFGQFPRAATCAAFAIAASLGLSACAKGPFHGAASMRVEVEVYKGPLSKEPEIQWAELKALIREAPNTLTALNDAIIVMAANNGYLPNYQDIIWPIDKPTRLKIEAPSPVDGTPNVNTTRVVSELEQTQTGGGPGSVIEDLKAISDGADANKFTFTLKEIENNLKIKFRGRVVEFCKSYWIKRKLNGFIWNFGDYVGCLISAQLHDDIAQLLTRIRKVEKKIEDNSPDGIPANLKVKEILQASAEVATIFKVKAFYWSEAHISAAPQNRLVRISMANFANTASELSNQIASRADALLKQVVGEGRPRQELATSVYLRDTAPTDFLNLYIWNRAAAPALIEDMILHPLNAFSSEETTDRVRVVERLFADHNWSKVNTVYASGQGEVAMALIKDDIGNWNLKSFDSDPTELVEAYADVTKAAIKAVADGIRDAGTGGVSSALLNTASRLTRGQIGDGGATAGGLNIAALHDRALKELDDLKKREGENQKVAVEAVSKATTARDKGITAERTAEENASGAELAAKLPEGGDDVDASGLDAGRSKAEFDSKLKKAQSIWIGAKITAERLPETPEKSSRAGALVDAIAAKSHADKARLELNSDVPDPVSEKAMVIAQAALLRAMAADAKAVLAEAEAKLEAAKAAHKAQYLRMLAEARDILDDHASIIDVLQEGATGGPEQ